MSTCPDSNLYSALADGEVPSPWRENSRPISPPARPAKNASRATGNSGAFCATGHPICQRTNSKHHI